MSSKCTQVVVNALCILTSISRINEPIPGSSMSWGDGWNETGNNSQSAAVECEIEVSIGKLIKEINTRSYSSDYLKLGLGLRYCIRR